ncbi:MAG: hypothetical protein ABI977_21535, partial [Acidobacteriota bacterium]
MGKRLKLVGGCLFFALMFLHAATNMYGDRREKSSLSDRGWEAAEKNGKPVIYRIDDQAHALSMTAPP